MMRGTPRLLQWRSAYGAYRLLHTVRQLRKPIHTCTSDSRACTPVSAVKFIKATQRTKAEAMMKNAEAAGPNSEVAGIDTNAVTESGMA
jgi:hypothetical protein